MKNTILAIRLLSVFFGPLISFPAVAASDEHLLTMEEFTAKVLSYYPKLRASHLDVQTALAKQMQAKAGSWPSLNLSGGYTVSEDPVNVFGMLLRQERFSSSDFELKHLNSPNARQNISSGVRLDLPLFDAMQTISRVRSARERLKASQAEEIFTQMEGILLAHEAYRNAVILENLLAAVNQVERDSLSDLEKAKDLKDKGMILGADYFAARVAYGDFTRLKNELSRRKIAMSMLLNIMMGEPIDQKWMLQEQPAGDVIDDHLDQLIRAAYKNRPDLKGLDMEVKALEAQVDGAEASVLPTISGFAEGTNDRSSFNTSGGNNYTAGVKATVPLFDPGRYSRIKEARALRERALSDLQTLKDEISKEIVQEFSKYQGMKDNLDVFKTMSDDALQGVSLMLPLYNEGRKSIVDLMEMRSAYLKAVEGYIKASHGLEMSRVRLLFLTGQLSAEAAQ